jgi:RNA polymerase sigma-70 factor (ECF subfamily)
MDPDQAIPLPSLSDEDIVARVLSGEARMFEALMRRHNSRVYRAARAILGDDHESEDVMQDAYVRAYEHLGEFRGHARFSTWLLRIAVHEALARARRGRRFDPIESHVDQLEQDARSGATPEQQASDREMGRMLDSAIDVLPPEFRSVFVLRIVEGLSGAETAECLGIAEETVKTRLHRARARLQHVLEAELEQAASGVFAFHLARCDRVVFAVLQRIAWRQGAATAT